MTARWTHQPARRVGLQPAFVFSPVPDAILRSQHPAPSLAVEHREVADRDSKGARLKISRSPLFHQELVPNLCIGEWIDSHAREYGAAPGARRAHLKWIS